MIRTVRSGKRRSIFICWMWYCEVGCSSYHLLGDFDREFVNKPYLKGALHSLELAALNDYTILVYHSETAMDSTRRKGKQNIVMCLRWQWKHNFTNNIGNNNKSLHRSCCICWCIANKGCHRASRCGSECHHIISARMVRCSIIQTVSCMTTINICKMMPLFVFVTCGTTLIFCPYYAFICSAQKFHDDNLFSVFAGKLCGLLAVLSVPSILKILIHTKASSTPYTAYKRYIETIFHTLTWYEYEMKPGSRYLDFLNFWMIRKVWGWGVEIMTIASIYCLSSCWSWICVELHWSWNSV